MFDIVKIIKIGQSAAKILLCVIKNGGVYIFKRLKIDGCNREYLIDEYGNIFDFIDNRFKTTTLNYKGYNRASFWINGKAQKRFVHRLVLLTFKPIENAHLFQVNHIDCDKQNNSLSNLEWCTQSENQKHAFKNNLKSNLGVKNPSCKLKESDVLDIINMLQKEVPIKQISIKYNVSKALISRIRNKKLWTNLTEDIYFKKSKYDSKNKHIKE